MNFISEYLRPHSNTIAFSVIATVLIIYGNDINRSIKKQIAQYTFIIRVSIFVAICAFGYGYATMLLARLLGKGFAHLTDLQWLGVLITLFIALGFMAERKRYI